MSDNYKFIGGLLLGAVAGAALAVFLNSEKGRVLLSDVKEGADKMQDDLKGKLQDFDVAVNNLLDKGKSFIDDFEQKTKQSDA